MRSVKERKTEGAPRERLYYSGTNHVWIIATICLYTTTRSILYSEVRLFFFLSLMMAAKNKRLTHTPKRISPNIYISHADETIVSDGK